VRCQGNKLYKNEAQGTTSGSSPSHCQWANSPRYVNECTHTHSHPLHLAINFLVMISSLLRVIDGNAQFKWQRSFLKCGLCSLGPWNWVQAKRTLTHIDVFANTSLSTSVAQKTVKMTYGAIWAIIEFKAYHILLQAHPELDLVGANTPMHNVFCSSPWSLHRIDKILKCDMITLFWCISSFPMSCQFFWFRPHLSLH
jgi:hypothetical protein